MDNEAVAARATLLDHVEDESDSHPYHTIQGTVDLFVEIDFLFCHQHPYMTSPVFCHSPASDDLSLGQARGDRRQHGEYTYEEAISAIGKSLFMPT